MQGRDGPAVARHPGQFGADARDGTQVVRDDREPLTRFGRHGQARSVVDRPGYPVGGVVDRHLVGDAEGLRLAGDGGQFAMLVFACQPDH